MSKNAAKLVFLFVLCSCLAHSQTHTGSWGRFGNHFFRNLCVSLIAEKQNLSVDYAYFRETNLLGIELFNGTNSYKTSIDLTDDNFFSILNSSEIISNLNVHGRFYQTREISNYLKTYLHEEKIKDHIMHKNPYNNRYNRNNDCFIHIRLTDAEQWNPGIQYYLNALSLIEYDKLYIASDDLDHQIIKQISHEHPNVALLYYDEVNTIQFGSTCKHVILSHGSFSAIIGYLSFFSDIYYKKYEADKMWYGDIFSIPNWNMIE